MRIAIIGGGISGLTIARLLSHNNEVVLFEKESSPGGLIKCDIVDGSLFHRTGGHVFNTKRKDVSDWFWGQFDKENEFDKSTRNAAVSISGNQLVPYPIENHVYCFNDELLKSFIDDLIKIQNQSQINSYNFEDFLKNRFGETLYNLYFKPYNEKVWRRDLSKVPLSWLEGKLPMPTVEEMFFNNIRKIEEQTFVHSSFFYPKKGGSQFLANRLSEGLDIKFNEDIQKVEKKNGIWVVNGFEADRIVFCGNIKQLPSIIEGQIDISAYLKSINDLEYHGTTTVFCEIDPNPYSWIYLPSKEHDSHRIICTGNFATSNNKAGKSTATIEFTDYISKDDILKNLKKIPFSPKYLTHHFERYTYPIQDVNTREMIRGLKNCTEKDGLFILGRFAEWEYFNMDAAIGSAIDLYKLEFA